MIDIIKSRWSNITIDRFSLDKNQKSKRFNSRYLCPEKERVNAFSLYWSSEFNFLVPLVYLKSKKKLITFSPLPLKPEQYQYVRISSGKQIRLGHFHTIPSSSKTLSQIPWQTQTFILVIPVFNHLFSFKNGFYGNGNLDLVILNSYMIPKYNLKHFYEIPVHCYMIPKHFHAILH